MILQQASITDYASILLFYNDVTEHTPEIDLYARWNKGKHPTSESIMAYIQEGCLYLYKEQDVIVGAMAVTMYQGADYHTIEWFKNVADNEVAVIHILAVSPEKQGSGIGPEMIREAIRLAKSQGMKAIRLDALATNTPAHKIYERLGFMYRGKQHLYAENTCISYSKTPCLEDEMIFLPVSSSKRGLFEDETGAERLFPDAVSKTI